MSWGTATALELFWTALGLIGMFVSGRMVTHAFGDLVAVSALGRNGALTEVARGNLREELIRLSQCVVIVGVGIAAALLPSARPSQPIVPLQIAVTVGVVLLVVLIVAGSISAERSRHRVMRAAGKVDSGD